MNESKTSSSQPIPLAGHVMEMLIKTTHRLHLQFESYLAANDIPDYLTGPRLRFLVTVSEAGKIRMSDMAIKCGIAPRTVTQFVDALEKEKLLVRISDPDDRRATLLQLTDTAAPLIAKARATMNESAEKVLAALPAEERSHLYEILHKLAATSTTSE